MSRPLARRALALIASLGLCAVAAAADHPVPTPPPAGPHEFVPQITPKGWKKGSGGTMATKEGKLTELGQWFYDIGRDPKNFDAYWKWNFDKRSENFKPVENPLYKGTNQGYQIHRFAGQIRSMMSKIKPYLPKDDAARLCNAEWTAGMEKSLSSTINDRGLWEYDGNEANMACHFHFIRTALWGMGTQPKNIWSREQAQKMVRTMLTDRSIFNPDDEWVTVTAAYSKKRDGENDKKAPGYGFFLKDGKYFVQGGLFIGWKDQPSLHGTWDGLAILNILYKAYPEPDPASPNSIFYLWNKEPAAVKAKTRHGFDLLTQRLWYDYLDKKGPTYCLVRNGQPVREEGPTDAKHLSDAAGYDRSSVKWWGFLSWQEIWGKPSKGGNDGLKAFLTSQGLWRDNVKTPADWKDAGAATQPTLCIAGPPSMAGKARDAGVSADPPREE